MVTTVISRALSRRFKCDSHAADLPSGLLSCDDLRPASLMMNDLNLRNCSCFDKACALATTNHKQVRGKREQQLGTRLLGAGEDVGSRELVSPRLLFLVGEGRGRGVGCHMAL